MNILTIKQFSEVTIFKHILSHANQRTRRSCFSAAKRWKHCYVLHVNRGWFSFPVRPTTAVYRIISACPVGTFASRDSEDRLSSDRSTHNQSPVMSTGRRTCTSNVVILGCKLAVHALRRFQYNKSISSGKCEIGKSRKEVGFHSWNWIMAQCHAMKISLLVVSP